MKITTIHAFIATEEDGGEGIIGMRNADGQWMPFVCADTARIDSLRPIAARIAAVKGVNVTLAKFSVREDVEVMYGKEKPSAN